MAFQLLEASRVPSSLCPHVPASPCTLRPWAWVPISTHRAATTVPSPQLGPVATVHALC